MDHSEELGHLPAVLNDRPVLPHCLSLSCSILSPTRPSDNETPAVQGVILSEREEVGSTLTMSSLTLVGADGDSAHAARGSSKLEGQRFKFYK